MSLDRGDKILVTSLGALALVSAAFLGYFLLGGRGDGAPGETVTDARRDGSRPRGAGSLARDGSPSSEAAEEETEEAADPARFAALIEELKAAILAEEVERANSIVASNPGLLEAAVPMLVSLLEDPAPSEKSKRLTIEFLKKVPTEEVRAALRRALERETLLGVRKALLMALGELKDVPSIPLVAKLLLDPNELHEIRVLAADTLGWIGHPDATPALLKMIESLKGSLGTDSEKSLMSHVLQAISLIKDRAATAPLLALLTDPGSSPWLVWQLVRALGGIGDPAVTQALLAIARAEASDPAFGKSARLDAIRSLFAVAAAGDAAAAKGIIELFQTMPDETFKREALHNLAKLADNGDVLKELNGVLDTSDQFAYKDLAVRGLAYKGGPDSFDRVLQELRASDKYDATDILKKIGQQYLRAGDEATKKAFAEKLTSSLAAESDPRLLEGLFESIGLTADPVLGEAIVEKVRGMEDGTLREKGYYAIVRSKPSSALPVLEAAILDPERDGQERYGAIDALSWWDNEEGIATLERLLGSFTADVDQGYRTAIEGAIGKARQRIEERKGRR